MKNFKKVLALVLVLATLMGLATVAGAAYKDDADISGDYTEAVKVLELIETMEGYPDGTFGPKKTITREEAAKLIAIFDNKDADISSYYTSINPFADEKGRWGESYVGYGYRAGIIAGMNATTYAPTANVTGTQFLKMALVTLGYDQEAEGFVGSSWAVNVLALAKKLGLVDNLADGWKPEKDLTREEAAQILLDTLKCDTVEYGQEAKAYNFKPEPTYKLDGGKNVIDYYTFKGKIYLTVAGAVKTGNKLYEGFKLAEGTSTDAFYRPYTKWTYDKDDDKTVEVMKAPKATFTTTFNTCELLVALGVKESDTKTKITIEEYYLNGVKQDVTEKVLQHSATPCKSKKGGALYHEFGAQGTLTQVFKMKNADGDTVYRICSIDTWLAKVTKVDKTTTARDNHKKGVDNVLMLVYDVTNADGKENWQINRGNHGSYCFGDTQCGTFTFAANSDGKSIVAYDDPEGLAKDDYVLMTYSWRYVEDKQEKGYEGVQSVDVVEAKEGRLSGFKAANVSYDPSQTRIDGEYVKDAVHFHLGFDDSKDSDNFGTHAFFYDAYGNVIGMKDGADDSSYGVLDKIWLEYNKGVSTVHANFVGLDGKVTEDVIVTEFQGIDSIPAGNKYAGYFDGKFGSTLADYVEFLWTSNGENYKQYYAYYDYLGKASVNSKNEYTLTRNDTGADNKYKHTPAGGTTVKFVKGTPVIEDSTSSEAFKVNSETKFLVRTDDVGTGSYIAWTGYTGADAKSVEAQGYDIVMDSDNKYAEIVYLYNIVAFTDGTVVAYVPSDANMWEEESKEDGDIYYILETYVNGVKTELKLKVDDARTIRDNPGRFWKFRYKDINEVTTATIENTTDFKLYTQYTVADYNDDGILTTVEQVAKNDNRKTIALAADCEIFSIREEGDAVVKEEKGLEYAADYIKAGKKVYFDFNDKNDDGVNQITALYVVENND